MSAGHRRGGNQPHFYDKCNQGPISGRFLQKRAPSLQMCSKLVLICIYRCGLVRVSCGGAPTTQTSTDLPACKTFSEPVLCSPLIHPAPLVSCIIPGFREEAPAVHPTTEHHIAAASSDMTDTDGASRSLSVDRAEALLSRLRTLNTQRSPQMVLIFKTG